MMNLIFLQKPSRRSKEIIFSLQACTERVKEKVLAAKALGAKPFIICRPGTNQPYKTPNY